MVDSAEEWTKEQVIFSRHLRNKLPASRNWVPNHDMTVIVGPLSLSLGCHGALPPGLTTEAAAPSPRPLAAQALGMQVHSPPGAECLHQKWIPLKPLSQAAPSQSRASMRISLVGLGNMWGSVSKSWDPMSPLGM